MPLVGLIDEDGEELLWREIKEGAGEWSDPIELLEPLYGDRDSYCDFSVTELMDDPFHQQSIRRFPYYESPNDMMDRMWGTSLHGYVEIAANQVDSVVSERQIIIDFDIDGENYSVGGRIDLLVGKTMWDWKTISKAKLAMLSSGRLNADTFEQQMNTYKFLAELDDGTEIDELNIRAIVRDWRYYEFAKSGSDYGIYPRGLIIPVKVWPTKKIKKWFSERLRLHIKASLLSDKQLYKIGECDTWGGRRCDNYCPMNNSCYFRKQERMALRKASTKKRKKT